MKIREESLTRLDEHARVSIAFEVSCVFDVSARKGGLGGLQLQERPEEPPYMKDYDAVPGNRPGDWGQRFDLANWGLLSAWEDGVRTGGAVIAFGTPDLQMLEGRGDLALLWDLRVAPELRGEGIGALLFAAVVEWADARGCRQLKVETQNINVPACRFYARQGCTLGVIHRFAYSQQPSEVQLLWYKDLTDPTARVS